MYRKGIILIFFLGLLFLVDRPVLADYTAGYIYQSITSKDGLSVYTRTCPINNSGIIKSECENWRQSPVSTLGVAYAKISSVAMFNYLSRGKQVLAQIVVSYDGVSSQVRICPIDDIVGLLFNQCSPWGPPSNSNSIGLGDILLSYSGGVVYTVNNNQQILLQTLQSLDGNLGWNRSCRVDNDNGILWDTCDVWKSVASNSLGLGNILVGSANSYVYTINGIQTLVLEETNKDGNRTWSKNCPINGVDGPVWASCSGWGEESPSANDPVGLRGSFVFKTVGSLVNAIPNNPTKTTQQFFLTDIPTMTVAQFCRVIPDLLNNMELKYFGCSPPTYYNMTYGGDEGDMTSGTSIPFKFAGRGKILNTFFSIDGNTFLTRGCDFDYVDNDAYPIHYTNCAPTRPNTLSSMGIGQAKTFSAFIYNVGLQLKLRVNALSLDGYTLSSAICDFNPDPYSNAIHTLTNCGMAKSFDLRNLNLSSEFNSGYLAIFSINGQNRVLQSFLSADGQNYWTRYCDTGALSPDNNIGFTPTNCGGFTNGNFQSRSQSLGHGSFSFNNAYFFIAPNFSFTNILGIKDLRLVINNYNNSIFDYNTVVANFGQ